MLELQNKCNLIYNLNSSLTFSLSRDSIIRGPGGMAVERAGTFLLRVVGMGSQAGTWSERGREGKREWAAKTSLDRNSLMEKDEPRMKEVILKEKLEAR